MQIVRDLGGYSMGRSDLVRRAMSKKKAKVMEEERRNFIFGNAEQGVPGCISRGVPEAVANRIYDEMTDFAKYAFNKSHAAAYAVVSMQTAFLKYYYPVEYMAALLTSVIDNPAKCAEYLLHARSTGIAILPPSVNEGEGRFTSEGGSIRCGMYSIKSVGRNVIDRLVKERREGGEYQSFRDFITRTYGKDMNRRAIENLIKAGACDCFGATRKQLMQTYPMIFDRAAYDSKEMITGQMSLFDFMAPEEKKEFEMSFPDVGEYAKEVRLAFEKEVLGIYLSGHPLEEYEQIWRSCITAVSTDFEQDPETGVPKVQGDSRQTIGGLIAEKTIKYTKTNKVMAFITIEDLVGTVEVLVFPKVYDEYRDVLEEDAKVFVSGRVSAEDERASKLICEKIRRFDEVPRELWIAFPKMEDYLREQGDVGDLMDESEGIDEVCVFIRDTKRYTRLTGRGTIRITDQTLAAFRNRFGEKNVTVRVKKG